MTTLLNIKIAPRRMLSLKEAAIYCNEPATTFEARCPVKPRLNSAGKKQYDIKQLDTWLDQSEKTDPDSDEAILGKLAG